LQTHGAFNNNQKRNNLTAALCLKTQQQQPFNNLSGNKTQSKRQTHIETQRKNLVVTQDHPTTTTDIE
jgi:hypothetical protein